MNDIKDAMALAGLSPFKPIDLQDDGKLTRYRIAGDKPGSCNGWVVLHGGTYPAGAFGSWKNGESHTWQQAFTKPPSAAEQAVIRKQRAQLNQAQAAEREAVYAAARVKAQRLWSLARPAFDSHEYLSRKQVRAYGFRQLRDMLLIPLRDTGGVLHSVQFITPDGTKRFLTGGRTKGCYCSLGIPTDSVLIAEGIATACTLYEATGRATAACFSCTNMLEVARSLRAKFPRIKLIVCADNDAGTPGNPGLAKAMEAAKAVNGYLAVPVLGRGAVSCLN